MWSRRETISTIITGKRKSKRKLISDKKTWNEKPKRGMIAPDIMLLPCSKQSETGLRKKPEIKRHYRQKATSKISKKMKYFPSGIKYSSLFFTLKIHPTVRGTKENTTFLAIHNFRQIWSRNTAQKGWNKLEEKKNQHLTFCGKEEARGS